MAKETNVERTSADTDFYRATDAYSALNTSEADAEDRNSSEIEDSSDEATTVANEEAETEESSDELLGVDDDIDPDRLDGEEDAESDLSFNDEKLNSLLSDETVPVDVKKRVREMEQGIKKVVERAKEAHTIYSSWEKVLTNRDTAADGFRQLVEATSQATGLTPEQLLAGYGLRPSAESPTQQVQPAVGTDFDNYHQHGYESRTEMQLAHQLKTMEEANARRDAELKQFMASQQQREQAVSQQQKEAQWLESNAPRIQKRIKSDFDGLEVTREQIRTAISGKQPKSMEEVVRLIKSSNVDFFLDHVKKQVTEPKPKKEMLSGSRPIGKTVPSAPADPGRYSAADALRYVNQGD